MHNLEGKKLRSICLFFAQTIWLLLANSACQPKNQEVNLSEKNEGAATVTKNVGKDCVNNYNPNTDYFPDQVNLNYTTGWKI